MEKTLGILGGGQLGLMLVQEAHEMGYRTVAYAPPGDNPTFQVADQVFSAAYNDRNALRQFARTLRDGVATIEFENVPVPTLNYLTELGMLTRPGAYVLLVSQNRLREKDVARQLGIPTTPCGNLRELLQQGARNPLFKGLLPGILKTVSSGYDGKGQKRVDTVVEAEAAWGRVRHVECVLERVVDFAQEISVIVARDEKGDTLVFPAVYNIHKNGILRETRYGKGLIAEDVASKAREYGLRLAEHLKVVGLLAVEFFVAKDGEVLFNEMAPRPHNSGHWTIEGCATSQYRALIQAIFGKPFTRIDPPSSARMINLIGQDIWDAEGYGRRGGFVHDYGKLEVRPGRKMGHVTFVERIALAAPVAVAV